jgi:hypothetical protein
MRSFSDVVLPNITLQTDRGLALLAPRPLSVSVDMTADVKRDFGAHVFVRSSELRQ